MAEPIGVSVITWWQRVRPRLARDTSLLFATRGIRLFAYGFLSVVLVLYLAELGLSGAQIGALLALTMLGDTLISLWLTTSADRLGRRRILLLGSGLMLVAGLIFAMTRDFTLLVVTATLGVLSPTGYEVGPFLSVEEAAIAGTVPPQRRVDVFAWYNVVGYLATAIGALAGGGFTQALQDGGVPQLVSYRLVLMVYALMGLILALVFARLSPAVEAPLEASLARPERRTLGLHRSRRAVFTLSGLFMLDAFAGGFVVQSIVAYWFHVRFGAVPAVLGTIYFGANVLAAFSALAAARVAQRIGLLNTMVFTHLPSNLVLMLVPLMPSLPLAAAALLLRFSISQMDVPARQAYMMALVSPGERSAASGVTRAARTTGAALSPLIAGPLLGMPAALGWIFVIGGGLKVVHDLGLFLGFRSVELNEGEEP